MSHLEKAMHETQYDETNILGLSWETSADR